MPSDGRFTALHRDVLLAVVALALLTAPLWVPATNLGEPTYTYERAEVVVDDEGGITYANDTEVPLRVDISENVACSNSWAVRPCGFERYLASNDVTIPSGIYTTNPSDRQSVPREKYGYALVNGTAYETVYTVNRSVQNENGMYRLDLALEPTDPDEALRSVSLPASADHVGIPPEAAESAREGEATSHREVEVPERPLRLDDGTYYRVYSAGSSDPNGLERLARTALTTVGPLFGLVYAYLVSRRFEVTHVGKKKY